MRLFQCPQKKGTNFEFSAGNFGNKSRPRYSSTAKNIKESKTSNINGEQPRKKNLLSILDVAWNILSDSGNLHCTEYQGEVQVSLN